MKTTLTAETIKTLVETKDRRPLKAVRHGKWIDLHVPYGNHPAGGPARIVVKRVHENEIRHGLRTQMFVASGSEIPGQGFIWRKG